MSKLVLLRGTPGIGKSAIARAYQTSRENVAWLDGDWVWRVEPFSPAHPGFRAHHAENAGFVLSNYLRYDFSSVIYSYCLPVPRSVDAVLGKITVPDVKVQVINVTATYEEWHRRRNMRNLREGTDREFYEQFQPGPYETLDTTGLSVEQSAAKLGELIESGPDS